MCGIPMRWDTLDLFINIIIQVNFKLNSKCKPKDLQERKIVNDKLIK